MTIDPVAEAAAIAGWKAGARSAGDRLVAMHEGLIRSIVWRLNVGPCELADLMQEGRIGLLRAATHYDKDRSDLAFVTYAYKLILQAARPHSLRMRYVVSVGRGVENKARSSVQAPDANEATLENLARRRSLLTNARRGVSLDAFDDDDRATHVDALIPANDVRDVEAPALILRDALALLHVLTRRERDIIERHLLGDETLDEIGLTFGVSRERIRQIETVALARMRRQAEQLGRTTKATGTR